MANQFTDTEIAWGLYNNDSEFYQEYVTQKGLFDDTKLIYNPVPKTVNLMNALVNQQKISIKEAKDEDKKALLKRVWANNNMQTLKYTLLTHLLLSQKENYPIIELNRKNGNVILSLHNPDNVEMKYDRGKIVYCKISGTIIQFNQESKIFSDVSITKEYYDINGYQRLIETKDGDEKELLYASNSIPVVEFTTDYDISGIINKTDRWNEIEAFLKNVFWITGDPIAFSTGGEEGVSKKSKDNMKSSRGKSLKLLHLSDGELRFLEHQGGTAELMLKKQHGLEEKIEKDYPEYTIAEILSEGDPSGDALEVKATEIKSRVKSVRSDLAQGLVEVNNKALDMLGKTSLDHSIGFQDILPKNVKELVDILNTLKGMQFPTSYVVDTLEDQTELVSDAESLKNEIENEKQGEYNRIKEQIDRELSQEQEA